MNRFYTTKELVAVTGTPITSVTNLITHNLLFPARVGKPNKFTRTQVEIVGVWNVFRDVLWRRKLHFSAIEKNIHSSEFTLKNEVASFCINLDRIKSGVRWDLV